MLAVQEYLQTHTFDELTHDFGIQIKRHPTLKLVILNYDQIKSSKHKTHPIVCNCRQLVLESTRPHKVVSKSFERFFNENESKEDTQYVIDNLHRTTFQEKHDGSLISVFFYAGEWHVITRGSWADSPIDPNLSPITWKELVWSLLDITKLDRRRCTYVFELCSSYNQIVRHYDKPQLVLLTVVDLDTLKEVPLGDLQSVANNLKLSIPRTFKIDDIESAHQCIEAEANALPGFEGFVARVTCEDGKELRIKMKSAVYLQLHHSITGVLTYKDVLLAVIQNEVDELVSHRQFSSWKDRITTIQDDVDKFKAAIEQEWRVLRSLTRKEIAEKGTKLYQPFFFQLCSQKLAMPTEDFWYEQASVIQDRWSKIQALLHSPTSV